MSHLSLPLIQPISDMKTPQNIEKLISKIRLKFCFHSKIEIYAFLHTFIPTLIQPISALKKIPEDPALVPGVDQMQISFYPSVLKSNVILDLIEDKLKF